VPALAAELEQLEQRLAASGRARQQASADAAQARERITAAREQQLRLTDKIEAARGRDVSIDERRRRVNRMASAAEKLQHRYVEQRRCQEANDQADTDARSAAAAVGFADLQEVRASVLDEHRCQLLHRQVEEYEAQLASLSARVHDPDLAAAGQGSEPDLTAVQTRAAAAQQAHEQSTRRVGREAEASAALHELSAAVEAVDARSRPVRRRYELVCDVSRCAEGSGGGNDMRMRLSSYVLAARLEQVASAASMRLVEMSGGRFTLVHCDDVERGGLRSGLGLRVVDAWTGLERETTTLSGGESFMASLALALGLADVVVAEAGGTSVDTLFVDEGFGSLDDETLEEVMDVLDNLRDGGRTVGLVSHVAELRARVPAQLQVVKTRRGSHLRQLAGQPSGCGP
jgi:exonuclease SbcC